MFDVTFSQSYNLDKRNQGTSRGHVVFWGAIVTLLHSLAFVGPNDQAQQRRALAMNVAKLGVTIHQHLPDTGQGTAALWQERLRSAQSCLHLHRDLYQRWEREADGAMQGCRETTC